MDGNRFDEITRNLARGTTRRGLLAGLAGIVAGIGAGRRGAAQVSQPQCGNVSCKNNPGKCGPGCVCCLYGNGNSRCRPPSECAGTAATTTTTTAAPNTTTTAAPTTTTTTTPPPACSTIFCDPGLPPCCPGTVCQRIPGPPGTATFICGLPL